MSTTTSPVADAVRMEGVRLRTLRSTYVLSGAALVLAAGVAVLFGVNSRDHVDAVVVLEGLTAAASHLPLTAVFAGVLGVLAVGDDHAFGLARPVLTTVPRRSALMAGRVAVLLAAAAGLALASLALDAAGLAAGLGGGFTTAGVSWAPAAAYVLQVLLWPLLGAGLALLLRNTTAAVVTLLVTPTIVEPLLAGAFSTDRLRALRPVVPYLPFRNGLGMVDPSPVADPESLTRIQSALVFGVVVLAVLALGWVSYERRDA